MAVRILQGDVRAMLRTLDSDSVDCVVTSPPYWGLRDYGVAGQIGMEATLAEHLAVLVEVFDEVRRVMKPQASLWLNYGDCYATTVNGRSAAATKAAGNDDRTFRDKPFSTVGGTLKPKDLAMIPNRLALALQEPRYTGRIKALEDRVWLAAIVDGEGSIFIHRQPEGTPTGKKSAGYVRTQDNFCVGLAISNTSRAIIEKCAGIFGKTNIQTYEPKGGNRRTHHQWRVTGNIAKGILAEIYPYLVGKRQEARIAIACPPSGSRAHASWQALKDLHKLGYSDIDAAPPPSLFQQGWWVRSEIIWGKNNPMPDSSGKYRPSTAHEKIWLLTKSAKAFYDAEAVALPCSDSTHARLSQDVQNQIGSARANGGRKTNGNMKAVRRKDNEASARPPGSRPQSLSKFEARKIADAASGIRNNVSMDEALAIMPDTRYLRNYEPAPLEVWEMSTQPFSEAHFATFPPELVQRAIKGGCPTGGLVLDPFGGAGTTGLVADRMGRDAILIELNPEYAALAERRIKSDSPLFAEVTA